MLDKILVLNLFENVDLKTKYFHGSSRFSFTARFWCKSKKYCSHFLGSQTVYVVTLVPNQPSMMKTSHMINYFFPHSPNHLLFMLNFSANSYKKMPHVRVLSNSKLLSVCWYQFASWIRSFFAKVSRKTRKVQPNLLTFGTRKKPTEKMYNHL